MNVSVYLMPHRNKQDGYTKVFYNILLHTSYEHLIEEVFLVVTGNEEVCV